MDMASLVLMTFLRLIAFSIPACFSTFYFASAFWQADISRRRIALFAVVQSVTGISTIELLPTSLHLFFFLADFIVLGLLFFRKQSFYMQATLILTSCFLYIVLEALLASISLQFFTLETLDEKPFYVALFGVPAYIALYALTRRMQRKGLAHGRRITSLVKMNQRIYIIGIILVLTLLTFFAMLLIVLNMTSAFTNMSMTLGIIFIALLGIATILYMTIRLVMKIRDEAVQLTENHYIDEVGQMYNTIRGQRHDFLNHVQVISAMLQRGKIEEAKAYMYQLVGDSNEVNDMLQIGHPAIAALIQAKLVQAGHRRIDLLYYFSELERLPQGKFTFDLIRIAANLIDNAMDKCEDYPEDERWVEVNGWCEKEQFFLKVKNPGSPMDTPTINKLFSPGYSTKNSLGHSGLGLSIVKEKVEHYKGKVEVLNEEEDSVTFLVKLPASKIT